MREWRVGLALAATLTLVATAACFRPRKTPTPEGLELTEATKAASGLATFHHPKQLAPKQLDDDVLALRPSVIGTFDMDDQIILVTNKLTSTGILDEYVRTLHRTLENEMKGWTETSRQAQACLGLFPGIELRATFVGEDGAPRRYWSCTFLRAPHGYKISYVVRETAAKVDEPLLRKVALATEITPLVRDP